MAQHVNDDPSWWGDASPEGDPSPTARSKPEHAPQQPRAYGTGSPPPATPPALSRAPNFGRERFGELIFKRRVDGHVTASTFLDPGEQRVDALPRPFPSSPDASPAGEPRRTAQLPRSRLNGAKPPTLVDAFRTEPAPTPRP